MLTVKEGYDVPTLQDVMERKAKDRSSIERVEKVRDVRRTKRLIEFMEKSNPDTYYDDLEYQYLNIELERMQKELDKVAEFHKRKKQIDAFVNKQISAETSRNYDLPYSYNFRLKVFQNGTMQLSHYHKGVKVGKTRKKDKPDWVYQMKLANYDETEMFGCCIGDMSEIPFEMDENGRFIFPNTNVRPYTKEELEEMHQHSITSSMTRSKKKIYDYGRSNVWEWFLTFTLEQDDPVRARDFEYCKKVMLKWLENVRRNLCPDMKYLVVPERHESGAFHFHALLANVGFEDDKFGLTFTHAINQAEYRTDENGEIMYDKNGQPIPNKYFGKELRTSYPHGDYIYNVKNYRAGFTTATKIQDTRKAVSYISKYITKSLAELTFGKRRYFPSNNLDTPVVTTFSAKPSDIHFIITQIERIFNSELAVHCMKSVEVKAAGYENVVNLFEFDCCDTDNFSWDKWFGNVDPNNPEDSEFFSMLSA